MRLFDGRAGSLDPGVFACPEIFRREMETVFARSWLFVGPEAWVGRPGDFYATRLGAEAMLLWRAQDGRLLLRPNCCDASFESLSRADVGRAPVLRCSCHGWIHRPEAGPGQGTVRLASYRGLVFATRDLAVAPFEQWVAPFRPWLDWALDAAGPRPTFYPGWTSWRLDANWKLPAQSYCGDADSFAVEELQPPRRGQQALTEAGVAVVSFDAASGAPDDAQGAPRPTTGTVFPNLSFDTRLGALLLWQPIAPERTEATSFLLGAEADSTETWVEKRRRWSRLVGPAGCLSARQDAVWASITRSAKGLIRRRHRLALARGLGEERSSNLPGRSAELSSEAGQRAFYDWWAGQLERPPVARPTVLNLHPFACSASPPARPGPSAQAEVK